MNNELKLQELKVVRIDTCTSCGVRLVGKGCVTFYCPSCSMTLIGRCRQCRNQSVKYKCKSCGFEGP